MSRRPTPEYRLIGSDHHKHVRMSTNGKQAKSSSQVLGHHVSTWYNTSNLKARRFSSSTSRSGAVRACVRRSSIVRRPGEGVIPSFSTSRQVGFSYRVVDGGPGIDRSYIRLCEDTSTEIRLHTRLGRAHECRSGVWLCAFALMSLISGTSAYTVPNEIGSEVISLLFRLLRLHRLIEARASRARALPDESPC
uniref:Uncharacterized protein n=1 Tax=Ananas comosus var. bracteatus TaxID=296719 RepID=A0A6V7QVW0_ANACO